MSEAALRKGYVDLKLEVQQPFVPDWSVAIFSSRESPDTLADSVRAVLAAIERNAFVDIIVNGNEPLAQDIAGFVGRLKPNPAGRLLLRVWYVAQGDKAHAWNQYLYGIWPGAGLAYFVDGYVRVHRHAFMRIATALAEDSHALAATGVPSQGHSSAKLRAEMQRSNGIHGNLYAVRAPVLEALRQRQFILPLGIYRTDPLLGAAIKFNLDPARHPWDRHRIRIVLDASWEHTPLSMTKPADLNTQLRRALRQGRGTFELLAIRQHLDMERNSLETLPETVTDLVSHWMAKQPGQFWRALARRPLSAFSLHGIKQKRDWSNATIPPRMLAVSGTGLATHTLFP